MLSIIIMHAVIDRCSRSEADAVELLRNISLIHQNGAVAISSQLMLYPIKPNSDVLGQKDECCFQFELKNCIVTCYG